MDLLIGTGMFIVILSLIEGAYFVFRAIRNPEQKRIRIRLRALSLQGEYGNESVSIDIMRKKLLSEVPWLNRLLLSLRWTQKGTPLLEQAGTHHTLGFFVLLSMLLASGGLVSGLLVTSNLLILIPGMAFLGMLPFLYVFSKKKRRMQKFERQLPDAMDLIARALKAGHAFTGGLKLVADEMDDPIGTELDKTVSEINFGVAVDDALRSLSNRVYCPDFKFFVISVILQRETGGNLAEILENIAHLIRERFKLQGRIKVLAAEGKLSCIILIILPFIVAFLISLLNPEYIKILITDPLGKILIAFALLMMGGGIFTMKKMIKIKV